MIESPDKALKMNHVSSKVTIFFFPVKHEELKSASTLNFMPSRSFSEFGFYI